MALSYIILHYNIKDIWDDDPNRHNIPSRNPSTEVPGNGTIDNAKNWYQASTLTQNGTGPVGPVTPRIYWSCKFFTGPTNFSWTLKEKKT